MTEPDLSVELCGKRLENPTVLASGILGSSTGMLALVAQAGAGALTTKSCGLKPRKGHPNPTVLEWGHGLINAVGLSNPGVDEETQEIRGLVAGTSTPVIASFFEDTVKGFAEVAQRLEEAGPAFLEANVSCPNVEKEFGGKPFALSPEASAKVTQAVKEVTKTPLIVKLSPNTPLLVDVAKACVDAGADALNVGNSFGPGMVINLEARRPVLANKVGGVTGPAIKPLALRCAWDVCGAVGDDVPVIATGGITTGKDAIEFVMAGATAVGIGSAVYYRGLAAFKQACTEMREWMQANEFTRLSELRGVARA